MKTKKQAFLIFMAVVVLLVVPTAILKVSSFFHRRGSLHAGAREITQEFPTPGREFEFIQAHAEIRIPASASEIHACINMTDTRVRFSLPAPDLPLFIRDTTCDQPFRAINARDLRHVEGAPEWWRPDEAKDLAECIGGNSYIRQQIMVDRTDDKRLVIYVLTLMEAFETPAE